MTKLTFSEAIDAINSQEFINSDQVLASALDRKVWVAEWHIPGCLSESFCVVTTKRDAIDAALGFAEGSEGAPRGMRADLEKYGCSDRVSKDAYVSMATTTIEKRKLRTLF